MTRPAKHNIPILQGQTLRENFRLTSYPYEVKMVDGVMVRADNGEEAPAADRVPIDLTGCTARMQARKTINSAEVLLHLTTENGGITLGGVAGTISLYLSDADTAVLTWTTGVYDLEIKFPNGDVSRRLYGAVTVSPEVTRD